VIRRPTGRMAAVGVTAALLALAVSAAALSDTSFTDPPGDSKGAPDITQAVVSNDATGVLTFRITTAAPIVADSAAIIFLDTDGNPATGDFGAEYDLFAGLDGFGLDKWDGTKWVETASPSLSMVISGNTVELKIARQEIGNVTRFGLSTVAALFDAKGVVSEDDAPDGGEWIYVLQFSQCANGTDDDGDGKADAQDLGCASPADTLESDDPVTLRAGKATVIPAKPRAGKAAVVSAAVTRMETGLGVSSGTARCLAHVGAKTLRVVGKVGAGRAGCRLMLPITSSGKMARGTITATVLGRTKVIPFSFRVS
jgi:hypothetical protein